MPSYTLDVPPSASTSRVSLEDMAQSKARKEMLMAPGMEAGLSSTLDGERRSARVRARSVGKDTRGAKSPVLTPARAHGALINDSDSTDDVPSTSLGSQQARDARDAAMTPDYTVDRSTRSKAATVLQHGRSTGHEDEATSTLNARRASLAEIGSQRQDPGSPSASPRPRLTKQIRSFFTSFTGESQTASAGDAQAGSTKARTSSEYDNIGGANSASRFQGLTASAQSLSANPTRAPFHNALAMPAARQATPYGLPGFNDDSPPLTPSSSEHAHDGLGVAGVGKPRWNPEYEAASASSQSIGASTLDRISSWTPFSSTASSSSGRVSPPFNFFAASTPESMSLPSRPSSISSIQRKAGLPTSDGLLPSFRFSPSSSPEPRHGLTHREHASATDDVNNDSTLLSALNRWLDSAARNSQLPPLRPHVPAMLFFLTAFIGSTIIVVLGLSTLPLKLPSHITDLTLTEIRDMSTSLRAYSLSSTRAFTHTLAVLGVFFTWKQSFTVPGSLIMNVVFGAMYGTILGTIVTSLLTAVGGVFCYLLMAPLGPLITALPGLNQALAKIQQALPHGFVAQGKAGPRLRPPITNVSLTGLARSPSAKQRGRATNADKASGNLWSYLLVLRLLPIVPYGLMNIACSALRVPLLPYGVTLALGSIPWNACTVQIGDLLGEVASAFDEAGDAGMQMGVEGKMGAAAFHDMVTPALHQPVAVGKTMLQHGPAQSGLEIIMAKIWNRQMMFKLLLMSIVSLLPMLAQHYLKARKSANSDGGIIEGGSDDTCFDGIDDEKSAEFATEADRLYGRAEEMRWRCAEVESDGSDIVSSCGGSHDNRFASSFVPPQPAVQSHPRTGNLRHSLVSLAPGRHPRIKRAIARAFA